MELISQLLWFVSLFVWFGGYADYAFGLAFAAGFIYLSESGRRSIKASRLEQEQVFQAHIAASDSSKGQTS